ncbi:unnamed protein product [Pleuronectes platessa]|uniref:Uncharacterized protein n=1 Tax=Pleuronectes platessa TaxID=8262 RepID=A0A9N7YVG0_PLEPL|nr:unnamed protein product [Pleuronectes platessa]
MFKSPCSRPRVHVLVFKSPCSRPCVHVLVFTSSCSRPRVHFLVFTSSCSRPRVHVLVFTSSCSHPHVVPNNYAATATLSSQPQLSTGSALHHRVAEAVTSASLTSLVNAGVQLRGSVLPPFTESDVWSVDGVNHVDGGVLMLHSTMWIMWPN